MSAEVFAVVDALRDKREAIAGLCARHGVAGLDVSGSALRSPPGNRLERLAGDRSGQHSLRINDRWRICFVWKGGDAHEVEICDYH